MPDYSNVLGVKPLFRRMQVYPRPEHFRRAREAVWMRPYDLAAYETRRDAVPDLAAEMVEPGMMGFCGTTESFIQAKHHSL